MAIQRGQAIKKLTLERAANLGDVEQLLLPCGVRVTGVRTNEEAMQNPIADACPPPIPLTAPRQDVPGLLFPGTGPTGDSGGKPLSEREREVLSLLVAGASDKEVAKALGVSRSTVESHVGNLYQKTGAANRVQLGVIAIESGLTGSARGTD